ncbi:hypothetical protein FB567DRAFT_553664 [Paraphoma chrysanthemicola]|uniref:Uncharacterized protein n=1 Tax=Paraphoma chrysanthemicola TaxID=798071 RepID=A0A8K0QWQ6_9PLEO|nr:hypothetical protein FB567DRAFT_553664 [Paraphoma chrysanthemicola]
MTDHYESRIFHASEHSPDLSTSKSSSKQLAHSDLPNNGNVRYPIEASDHISDDFLEIYPKERSAGNGILENMPDSTRDTHMQESSFLYSLSANAMLNEDTHDMKAQEISRILRGLHSLTGEVDHLLADQAAPTDSSASNSSATPIIGLNRDAEPVPSPKEHSRDGKYGVLDDKRTSTEKAVFCSDEARAACELTNGSVVEREGFLHAAEHDEIAETILAVAWGALTCIVFLAGAL